MVIFDVRATMPALLNKTSLEDMTKRVEARRALPGKD